MKPISKGPKNLAVGRSGDQQWNRQDRPASVMSQWVPRTALVRRGLCAGTLLFALAAVVGAQTIDRPRMATVPDPSQPISPGFPELAQYLNGRDVTISDVVRIALVTNRTLAQAKASYLIAEGQVAEANSALFPTIGSAVEELRLNAPVPSTHLTNPDPTTLAFPIGERVEDERIEQRIYSIGATIPIDIFGEIRAAVDQAKYQRLASRLDFSRVVNDQVATVKSAFYDVLRAKALRKVAEDDLATARVRLKDAQSRFAAQVVTRLDVLRAQTDVATAEQNLISAVNRVEQLYAQLNRVIGIRGDIRFQVSEAGAVSDPGTTNAPAGTPTGNSSAPAKPTWPEMVGVPGTAAPGVGTAYGGSVFSARSPEVQAAIKQAIAARPEVLEANADIRAAQSGLRVAVRSEMPSLTLGYSYSYAPDAGGVNPVYHQWIASAIFSVPIYDAGLARARLREARGSLESAQTTRREAEDEVTLDVQQALIAVNDARDRVRVAEVSLLDAQEAYRLATLRYQEGVSSHAGVSPLLELSDAQSALTIAETNQVNSVFDYNNARSLLQRALGVYTKNPS